MKMLRRTDSGALCFNSAPSIELAQLHNVVGKAPLTMGGLTVPAVRLSNDGDHCEGRFAMCAFCGVYSITNTKNKKRYIGSTVNIAKRWKEHRARLLSGKHHSSHLQAAWGKYGESSFQFEIVITCEQEDLIAQEQFWIDAFQSANPKYGYNIAPIAGSTTGLRKTKEWRAKIADSLRLQWSDPEQRKKNLAKKQTLGARLRVSKQFRDFWSSKEVREKQSDTQKRRFASQAERKKTGDAIANAYRNNSDIKRKVSAAVKEQWNDPEVRRKRTEGVRNARRTTQSRVKTAIASAKTYKGFVAPDGTIYQSIFNLTEFCRERNLDTSSMIKVGLGKRKTHKGWRAYGV